MTKCEEISYSEVCKMAEAENKDAMQKLHELNAMNITVIIWK